jgi:cytochrome b561
MPPVGQFLTRHSLATRAIHALFATSIIVQLGSGAIMRGPHRGQPGDWLFAAHEYAGLAAAGLAFGFWLILMARRQGTAMGQLFPWFSDRRLIALWEDVAYHGKALMAARLPEYREDSTLASAVHGLGLLLMTAMAATGCIYLFGQYEGAQRAALFSLDLIAHKLLANLAWAYLIGHAGLGLIHHYTTRFSLGDMWSLARNR